MYELIIALASLRLPPPQLAGFAASRHFSGSFEIDGRACSGSVIKQAVRQYEIRVADGSQMESSSPLAIPEILLGCRNQPKPVLSICDFCPTVLHLGHFALQRSGNNRRRKFILEKFTPRPPFWQISIA
jgi:hypothetical protein